MLICSKCGMENPLGRVFCGSCGAKLELSHMGSDTVAGSQSASVMFRHGLKLVIVVILVIAAVVVTAFVPKTRVIGKKGTNRGSRRVGSALRMIKGLPNGRALKKTFTEADINAYLEFSKARKLKMKSVSVAVGDGYFRVRVIRAIGPFALGPVQIEPKISHELMCVPVGDAVVVRRANMGHLPLFGPFKTLLVRGLHRKFAGQKEWAAFEYLATIQAEENRITLEVEK